ncbi:hypothetical protein DJ568_01925 [Mucilaginibacter hurinus]|uniref:Glycosyl transferase family 1 domain-containing protein n=1 Tax=Mucilaginibacter hurinus TaxID=2201324 RepID=A0A367GT85_9SPHI|nr:glycosyltransferase family 4 protein [Mucilaginibacter hurinus]RCH56642.1 hypothetical protein DJ568_01925 [Mucilaginibacter hurinus]
MKLLHVYDHDYYEKDGVYYSSSVNGKKAFEPYLLHFDSVTVLANLSDKEVDFSKLDVSSSENINFAFAENKRLFGNYVKNYIKEDAFVKKQVLEHDGVAVRLPSELGLFVIETARKYNKPYAIEVVGDAWDSYWYHGSLKGKVMAAITEWRTKRALWNAKFAIYVTQYYLQKAYPMKKGLSRNASNVVLPDQQDIEIYNRHIERLKNPPAKLRFGLIGTLNVAYKGLEESLLALKSLINVIPDFEILFVGKGDIAYLQNLIDKHNMGRYAIIVGKISSGQPVFDFLDSLDVYLHPSKHEGLPRAVIEAMSRACPVLASSIAGTPELLPAKYIHKPGDHKTLAQHIKQVITNKAELCSMAKENFEKSSEYSFTEIRNKKGSFWGEFKKYILQTER